MGTQDWKATNVRDAKKISSRIMDAESESDSGATKRSGVTNSHGCIKPNETGFLIRFPSHRPASGFMVPQTLDLSLSLLDTGVIKWTR